jgi:hypothetical protein
VLGLIYIDGLYKVRGSLDESVFSY